MSDSCYVKTKWYLEIPILKGLWCTTFFTTYSCVHSSFSKYLLVIYNMPGIVLGTDRKAIQKDNNVCSYEAYILVQQINNTINILSKVTGTLEKNNTVREMGFWGRDKVWNCKQDIQCTPWCERWGKQGGKRARHVNTKRRDFQEKGMTSAKALR